MSDIDLETNTLTQADEDADEYMAFLDPDSAGASNDGGPAECEPKVPTIDDMIAGLPNPNAANFAAAVEMVLGCVAGLNEIEQDRVIGAIYTRTKVKRTTLAKTLRRLENGRIERPEWQARLSMTSAGLPRSNTANVSIVLRNAEELRNVLAWNDFTTAPEKVGDPPWLETFPGGESRGPWENEDNTRLVAYLEEAYGFPGVPRDVVVTGVDAVAQCHRFHPVRDYFEARAWDGVKRLDTWLTDYLHVKEIEGYTRMVARKWMISAVARTVKPGCQADYVLSLEGEQRIGKTSALRVLALDQWHTEPELGNLESKECVMLVQGCLIMEFGEGHVINKASAERLKQFISTRHDDIVPKYANVKRRYDRHCVFAMSVNRTSEYLLDDTGNARFWPVEVVGYVDIAGLQGVRDQLWAEAVAAFKAGEQWWPTADELELAKEVQALRETTDPWEAPISRYLSTLGPDSVVTIATLLSGPLNLQNREIELKHQRRAGRVLRKLGWWSEPLNGVRVYRMGIKDAERARREEADPPVNPAVDDTLRRLTEAASDTGSGIIVDED